ncbi:MAG: FecR domain-containing protein [Chitinophaga sp.]|uniref:FecR family protein n=1 Tax=Chitinophaga sp. TaxID=1869181 RepID=UPI001B1C79F4|nr:FecR domain-containing protein [Chitinophaga sp.]MBO9731394.1 FecR domain-containing protein [Chitinophaga sp.]
MNYGGYDAADFAADADFRAWVLENTNAAFWIQWQAAHPEQEPVLQEARAMVLALRFRTNEISTEEMAAVKYQVDELLNDAAVKKNNGPSRRRWLYTLGASIAAATLTLLAITWYRTSHTTPQKIIVQTGFGETKIIHLPDGSVVQLNANSTVAYPAKWEQDKIRTVALQGEAYFNVSKSPAGLHPKFRVMMPAVTIEVKGTAFNVYHRHNKVMVLLEEGKIVVNDSLQMKPGDMMLFASGTSQRLTGNAAQLTAWKQHRLVFHEETLLNVAQQLSDIYGYHIEFRNKRMEGLLFTGSGPAADPALLLKAMTTVHQLKMTQHNSVIIFE